MPEQQIASRGGAVRWRTICPHGKGRQHCKGPYMHVAVVRKAGPRGGRTIAGPVKTRGA